MAIPGNSKKDNFSKAIIKEVIPGKEISGNYMHYNLGTGILGNPRQSNSRHGNCRPFQLRQFQDIEGNTISGNSRRRDSI